MAEVKKKLLCFGEVLWDIIDGTAYIGGAPFNVAAHSARGGIETWLVSAVGDDSLGKKTMETIRSYSICTDLVQVIKGKETGTVVVSVDAQGQPSYDIRQDAAWDCIRIDEAGAEGIKKSGFSCLLFGTLAQRCKVSELSLAVLKKKLSGCDFCCDINLRQSFWNNQILKSSLRGTKILKLNGDELNIISQSLYNQTLTSEKFAEKAAEDFGIKIIALTLGADGVDVYESGKKHHISGIQVNVVDTVGAGDAFTAGFLSGLMHDFSVIESAEHANKLGAETAARRGALPPL